MLGSYTNLNEMKYKDHFIKTISHCLNPNINESMKYMQDEVNYGFKVNMPTFEGDGMSCSCIVSIFSAYPHANTVQSGQCLDRVAL